MSRTVPRGFDPQALKTAREARGLTHSELGRLAGVSQPAVWTWENGTRAPNVDKLARVAKVLRVHMSQLVTITPGQETLTDLRILAGLTQPQLAQAVGISTASLSKIERGETQLTEERATRLASRLDVTVTELHAAWQRAHDRPPGAPA